MQLGWIDFSTEERNKVLATLKLLGSQTALDELGRTGIGKRMQTCGGRAKERWSFG